MATIQKTYGSGATVPLKLSRKNREFFGVESIPFHVGNDIPTPKGGRVLAVEIIQSNDKKGVPTLYRLSVVERPNGESYSQAESHVEDMGSFSAIHGRFEPMDEYDLTPMLSARMRGMWDKTRESSGRSDLFSQASNPASEAPSETVQPVQESPKVSAAPAIPSGIQTPRGPIPRSPEKHFKSQLGQAQKNGISV